MSLHKSYAVASFKALPTEAGEPKKFEAIVSAFGNVDLVGDRVVKGAFEAHLKELREAGDPIPVIWSHEWGNPNAHIGWADPKETVETNEGLRIIGYLDDKPFANQVYDLLKDRRVKEFSFAYDVIREKVAKDGANELLELRILEVGPTLKGANPETQLLGVKNALEAARAKEITDTRKSETDNTTVLVDAVAALTEATELLRKALNEQVSINDEAEVKDDGEPDAVKPDEPEAAKGEEHTEDAWLLNVKQQIEGLSL